MSSVAIQHSSTCSPFMASSLPTTTPATAPSTGWLMAPRCTMEFQKCEGGFKIFCHCEDEVGCGTLQNLCRMLADGTCSCCCTVNGIVVAQCNLVNCHCKCEFTADGCCVTCTSGDEACCAMLQACCDYLACCKESGCCCYLCFGGTPICCDSCCC